MIRAFRFCLILPLGLLTPGAEPAPVRQGKDSHTNSWAGDMVLIQGGAFHMGSNEFFHSDENPIRSVAVSDFYIGKYEVTVEQYLAFCIETNTHWPDWLEAGSVYHVETGSNVYYTYYKCMGYGRKGAEKLPIVGVSWHNAVAYCEWLSTKTGQRYRLPTEAEWEYAAGGGSGSRTAYAGTSSESSLGNYAWYGANSGSETHPVGQKQPNGLGLYDMSGNVWEWCSDWYGYYPSEAQTNPEGPSAGVYRVLRGGSWGGSAGACRVACRYDGDDPDNRSNFIGFRLARQ